MAYKELTWKDASQINDIMNTMLEECGDNILYDTEEEFFREVANRFNKIYKVNI